MLTDKDIDKLMKVLATKDEVERIVDRKLQPIIETQQRILTGIDGIVSVVEGRRFEDAARDMQLARHDAWIQQLAKKTQTKLQD